MTYRYILHRYRLIALSQSTKNSYIIIITIPNHFITYIYKMPIQSAPIQLFSQEELHAISDYFNKNKPGTFNNGTDSNHFKAVIDEYTNKLINNYETLNGLSGHGLVTWIYQQYTWENNDASYFESSLTFEDAPNILREYIESEAVTRASSPTNVNKYGETESDAFYDDMLGDCAFD
jgi:hypothetical protein